MLTAMDSEACTFSLRYQNKMILEEGIHWIETDDGQGILAEVSLGCVYDNQDLYRKAVGQIKSHEKLFVSITKATPKTIGFRKCQSARHGHVRSSTDCK